jgi:hypothetical protein
MADVGHLRLVYFTSADEILLTLSATPTTPKRLELDESLKNRLMRLFCAWMRRAQPGWNNGLEAGGLIEWDLGTNRFTHKHSGYRLQPFNVTRRG